MKLTPAEFLKEELRMGISPDNPQFVALAEATIAHVSMLLKFYTVLDYGAGVGVYSEAAANAGYDVYAYDVFKEHQDFMKKHFPDLQVTTTLRNTDLMLFIEVAEHMEDYELDDLFCEIFPKYILFSSTPNKADNDEEWGHINIKTQEEWINFFKSKGYEYHCAAMYPTTWAMIFRRKS